MALTEKTTMVLDYLKAHDTGEGVAISEIAEALGLKENSVRPVVVLSMRARKDGSRGALAEYVKKDVEGVDKPVGYAVLTDEGRDYVDED